MDNDSELRNMINSLDDRQYKSLLQCFETAEVDDEERFQFSYNGNDVIIVTEHLGKFFEENRYDI